MHTPFFLNVILFVKLIFCWNDFVDSNVAEYKLKGYPFSCGGEEGINARQLICRLLETLRDRGWQVLAGVDIGPKRSFEKSNLLMSKCESARLKFACVAPADMDRWGYKMIRLHYLMNEKVVPNMRPTPWWLHWHLNLNTILGIKYRPTNLNTI